METLPTTRETTVSALPVSVPRIVGEFAVGLPDRPITVEEAAEAINRLHDFVRDVDEYDAAFRWHVGRLFHALPEGTTGKAARVCEMLRARHSVWRGEKWVYECSSLYRSFRSEGRLIGKVRDMKDHGGYSYSKLRDDVLRPEREAEDDGASLDEQIEGLVEAGEGDFFRGEEKFKRARELMPENHPLRETVEVTLQQAEEHRQMEAEGLRSEARVAAERGPWRSEEYRRFVRDHGCWCCPHEAPAAHFHHALGRDAMAEKKSDAGGLGLCPQHHDEWHGVGQAVMEGRYGFDTREVTHNLFVKWVTTEPLTMSL